MKIVLEVSHFESEEVCMPVPPSISDKVFTPKGRYTVVSHATWITDDADQSETYAIVRVTRNEQ